MFFLVARGSLSQVGSSGANVLSRVGGAAQIRGREIQQLNSVGHPLSAVYLQRREFCPAMMIAALTLISFGVKSNNSAMMGFGGVLMVFANGNCGS